jgi:hypothetical protein
MLIKIHLYSFSMLKKVTGIWDGNSWKTGLYLYEYSIILSTKRLALNVSMFMTRNFHLLFSKKQYSAFVDFLTNGFFVILVSPPQ